MRVAFRPRKTPEAHAVAIRLHRFRVRNSLTTGTAGSAILGVRPLTPGQQANATELAPLVADDFLKHVLAASSASSASASGGRD